MVTKKTTDNRSKALILALSCVVSWAFIPIVARLGQQSLDNYQFLFWSCLLSFIVLLFVTFISGKLSSFRDYKMLDWTKAVVMGFLGSYLYYVLLYFAYAHAVGLEVLALQYTWPIFVVIFSVVILKELVNLTLIISTLMSFLGVLIVLTKGNIALVHLENVGVNLLALFASSVFGLFSVLSKKINFEPFTATTIFFGSATIFSLISMVLMSNFVFPPTTSVIPLVVNGALINGLSYVLWLRALSYANASFVAQFVFLTPIIASILIVIFFREPFTPIYLLSMGLIVGAGVISQHK